MCEQSLRKVGQGILELLIGNEKVTDGQTDRPTCAKQSALSSSKGGKKYACSPYVTQTLCIISCLLQFNTFAFYINYFIILVYIKISVQDYLPIYQFWFFELACSNLQICFIYFIHYPKSIGSRLSCVCY